MIRIQLLLVIPVVMLGCSTAKTPSAGQLEPADFASAGTRPTAPPEAPPPPPSPSMADTGDAGTDTMAPVHVAQTEVMLAKTKFPGSPQVYTVTAMIGQVHGKALYANQIFDRIEEGGLDLQALGSRLLPPHFKQKVREIVAGKINEMVFDALILGEAERDLSERERQWVTNAIAQQREELLRRFGLTSPSVAERHIRIQTGWSLEETLEQSYQEIVVHRYLRQKVIPKINVTRKDIERYYADHPDQFNPPPTRKIVLMWVSSSSAADQIDRMLGEGRPFAEIAQVEPRKHDPEHGNFFSDRVKGNDVLDQPQLNEAMLGLKAGEHSPRIEIGGKNWWVHVETLDQPPARSLRESQLNIERVLHNQRYRRLTQHYKEQLLSNGSYSPSIEQMTDVLVQVAMARYASRP